MNYPFLYINFITSYSVAKNIICQLLQNMLNEEHRHKGHGVINTTL